MQITNLGFTGIDQAYEAPLDPELELKTVDRSEKETMMEVISLLENNVSKLLFYNKSTIISEFLLQI